MYIITPLQTFWLAADTAGCLSSVFFYYILQDLFLNTMLECRDKVQFQTQKERFSRVSWQSHSTDSPTFSLIEQKHACIPPPWAPIYLHSGPFLSISRVFLWKLLLGYFNNSIPFPYLIYSLCKLNSIYIQKSCVKMQGCIFL